jgi:hypothetical protein
VPSQGILSRISLCVPSCPLWLEPFCFCQTTQNIQPVSRRIGRHKVGDRASGAPRARKEVYRPFRDAPLFHVNVLAWRWFSYVLLLQDQSERFFSARKYFRKTEGGRVGGEWVVIIVSVFLIGCSVFGVTPYPIFQNRVPDKTSSRGRILPDACQPEPD